MNRVYFCFAIAFAILVSSSSFASDNPHVETCTRLANETLKSTTDLGDTASNCKFIENPYAASCVETIAAAFAKYPITGESVYDGIDANHILACAALFERHSSVKCLNEILTQRHPTVDDIIACSEK